jgi:glyoxylase-like metal-dependent hydrolase (beta-lactamase superfamily II)
MTKLLLVPAILLAVACHETTGASPAGGAATAPLSVRTYTSSEASNLVTSTLILGDADAILIDAQFIDSEARNLVALIQSSGRRLTTVYVTHAHPDHHFGLAVLVAAFPDVKVLAHPRVAAEMKSTWQAKHDYWKTVYGADLTDVEVDATPYDAPALTLEGREVRLVGPAEGDLPDEVAVFVPSIATLITGDTAYDGTHVWLADTARPQWDAWIANLRALQALDPTVVVAGHRDPSHAGDPRVLASTLAYIQDFEAAVLAGSSDADVVATMKSRYPSLALPAILELSAKAAFSH